MKINVPPSVRVALYVLTLVGAPAVVYLRARGIIGDLELTLWGAEVTAVSALAAFNVPASQQVDVPTVMPGALVDEPAPVADAPVPPAAKKAAAKRPAKKAAPKPPKGLS